MRRRSRKLLILLLAGAVALGVMMPSAAQANAGSPGAGAAGSVVSSAVSGPLSPVRLANLANFRAGQIISDAVFFNASTMSAPQIQSFLEARVPTCRSGYTCLKDWTDTSRTVAGDAMCGPYSGASNERASTIIYKVAQACGINPQVILTTLQKEQGLVTHDWPSDWRYRIAMGQGCPDTAACDTRYYGFFNQVYGAAWQFKRYANPPGTSQYFTWYAPGRTWDVLYNPDQSCGSSPVSIENQATSNLYYYTPYQPNRAALNTGYGEGDGCSAYGNRNFYNYFTDWFGSTVAYATSGSIATAYNAQGGPGGWLGYSTAEMVYSSASGGGWYQYFQNGIIFVLQSGPTVILRTGSALTRQFMSTGGPSGWLGWPIAEEACGTAGCAITFQGGVSAWSNQTGAIQQATGAIQAAWVSRGGVNSATGVPAGPMLSVSATPAGWYQRFDNSYIFQPSGRSAVDLPARSGITQRYLSLNGPSSALGWPRVSEQCVAGACATSFDNATSAWSPGNGVVDTSGPIAQKWQDDGALGSWLGAPIAQATSLANGASQQFQNGTVFAPHGRAATALRATSGITLRYTAAGGPSGRYGWPTGEEQCGTDACATAFDNAAVTWSSIYGLRDVSAALRTEWLARGGLAGTLGAATTDAKTPAGSSGLQQDFIGGWVYIKNGRAPVTLRPDSGLAQRYRNGLSGADGELGWPVSAEVCDDVECRIVFDNGTLAWSRTTGVISRRG